MEKIFSKIQSYINGLDHSEIPPDRKELLNKLSNFIRTVLDDKEEVKLHFICTHNSRRSQMAQLWAQTAAYYFNIDATSFSGGVEVTSINSQAAKAIKRAGFKFTKNDTSNPVYTVFFAEDVRPVPLVSKLYDDGINPKENFAAIMTCSEADENCPFIPGAAMRIPLPYDDPKEFDGTPEEAAKYDDCLKQIANEIFYAFSAVKK